MHPPTLTPISPADHAALLVLNNAHALETSLLTPETFAHLVAISWRAIHAAPALAFCLTLDHTAPYDNPNFHWFRARLDRFIYIDRVVVSAAARGRGVATALYADIMQAAIADGHHTLCCEINSEPPNPGSDAFHAALGFAEAGRATLTDRGKTVRYLTRALTSPVA